MSKQFLRYKSETLTQVQGVLVEVLEEFKRICEENNLTYFMFFGSAIGVERHKGFIPWDDDLDVAMFRDDYEKFIKICEDLPDNSLCELMSVMVNKENASTVTKFQKRGTRFVPYYSRFLKVSLGIAIDIFPLDIVPENKKLRLKQMRIANFYEKLLFLRKTPFPYIPYKGIKNVVASATCVCIWAVLSLFHVSTKWLYKRFDKNARKYNDLDSKYVATLVNVKTKEYWEYEKMLPTVEAPFENTTVSIPGNNHDILTILYGDYMELPPKNKRVNHAPIVLEF